MTGVRLTQRARRHQGTPPAPSCGWESTAVQACTDRIRGAQAHRCIDSTVCRTYASLMSDSTSVRLSQHTRDAVNKLAAERGLTADRAIAVAIAAVREEEWRRQAEQEVREMAADPVDRALVAETMRFLDDE